MAIDFGYARVSTAGQSLDAQLDALRAVGVDERHVHVEKASGRRADRPVLAAVLDQMTAGDMLVVTKLDRLGRSMTHLVQVVDELERRGVALRSLSEAIDAAATLTHRAARRRRASSGEHARADACRARAVAMRRCRPSSPLS